MYGHRISVQYRGRGTFGTIIGGALTIFTVCAILLNLVSVLNAFATREHQLESYRRFKRDLLSVEPETLTRNKFLTSVSSFKAIPESIGKWRAYRYQPYADDVLKKKIELTLAECSEDFKKKSEEYYAKRFAEDKYKPYIDNARCIVDEGEDFIAGTSNDSNFVEIAYEFDHCKVDPASSVVCDSDPDKRLFWADQTINPVLNVMQQSVDLNDFDDPIKYVISELSLKGNTRSYQYELVLQLEKN